MPPDSDAVRPVGSSLPGTGIYPTSGGKSHIRPGSKPAAKKKEERRKEDPPREDVCHVDRYA